MRPIRDTAKEAAAAQVPAAHLMELRRQMALVRRKMLKNKAAALFPQPRKPDERRKRCG